MPRVYTLPHFNILCRVWFAAFPDDLSTWDGLPPIGPPDIDDLPCQLYIPRWRPNQWLHALGNSCFRSLLNAGMAELRYAFGEDLQVPWGVSEASLWSEVPLIECPKLSGRYYAGCVQENRHTGFPNQYTICLMAQIGPFTPGPPPTPVTADDALGLALTVELLPPELLAAGALGLASSAEITGQSAAPDLPLGLASSAELPGLTVSAPLPLGLAGQATGYPLSPARTLALGLAAAAILGSNAVAAPLGLAGSAQELFPSKSRDSALGLAAALAALPPKYAPDNAIGLAASADYRAVVLRNPCSTIGAPLTITLACLTQSGTLTGWTGQAVVLTYNSGAGNWQGTLTKGGNSGTITGTSTASGKFNFSGSSGANWTVSTALSDDTVSCGPPFSGTSGNHATNEGLNTGNTTWSYN